MTNQMNDKTGLINPNPDRLLKRLLRAAEGGGTVQVAASDLIAAVERISILEAPVHEVMAQAQEFDGVNTLAYIRALHKKVEGQRKHIATLEKKMKSHDRSDAAMCEALNSGDGAYRP